MCAARQWAISSWKLLCKSQNKRHFDAVLKKKRSRFFYFVVFGKYHGRARLSYTSSRKYKSFKSIELISNAFMQAPLNASERTNQVHAFISQMRSAHIFLKKLNCAPNDVLFHAPNVPSLRFLSIVFFLLAGVCFFCATFFFSSASISIKTFDWASQKKSAMEQREKDSNGSKERRHAVHYSVCAHTVNSICPEWCITMWIFCGSNNHQCSLLLHLLGINMS